jgi:sulfotransferase family protein
LRRVRKDCVETSTGPAVTDLKVRLLSGKGDELMEAAIASPVSGGTSGAWAVRVNGHVLGGRQPVVAVEAIVPGRILATARPELPSPDVGARHPDVDGAGTCGFTLLVDTLGLPRQFEFRIRATLDGGSRVKVAAMRGQRRRLVTAYTPRLQPLMVTSLGRSGTTLLMQLLAAHAGVVTYDRPPYEARGGKYWLHVLQTLAAPTDAGKRVGAPMEFHLETLAAGGNPFYSAQFAAWPEVEAWSGSDYVVDLAAFCQRSIDGWYLATAAAQKQAIEPLRYFAEKQFPDRYTRLMRELYPEARELFLVRDFRDMIASMRAYNERKAFGDFGRRVAESEAEWVTNLRRGVVALRDAWRERGEPGALVRYEDLVLQPENALPPILAYLGLDAAPETVARLIAAAAPDAPALQGHATAASPQASIGRWRQDLPPDLRTSVEETFGELLEEFGYDTGS